MKSSYFVIEIVMFLSSTFQFVPDAGIILGNKLQRLIEILQVTINDMVPLNKTVVTLLNLVAHQVQHPGP